MFIFELLQNFSSQRIKGLVPKPRTVNPKPKPTVGRTKIRIRKSMQKGLSKFKLKKQRVGMNLAVPCHAALHHTFSCLAHLASLPLGETTMVPTHKLFLGISSRFPKFFFSLALELPLDPQTLQLLLLLLFFSSSFSFFVLALVYSSGASLALWSFSLACSSSCSVPWALPLALAWPLAWI